RIPVCVTAGVLSSAWLAGAGGPCPVGFHLRQVRGSMSLALDITRIRRVADLCGCADGRGGAEDCVTGHYPKVSRHPVMLPSQRTRTGPRAYIMAVYWLNLEVAVTWAG